MSTSTTASSISRFLEYRETGSSHTRSVKDIKWNVDGTFLGTVSSDRTCKIKQFDGLSSGCLMRDLKSHTSNGALKQIDWHPSDRTRYAIAGDDPFIELYDTKR